MMSTILKMALVALLAFFVVASITWNANGKTGPQGIDVSTKADTTQGLSLIHISEPTRPY